MQIPNVIDSLYIVFWITLYILILLGFLSAVFFGIGIVFRRKNEQKDKFKLTFLQVKIPSQNEIEIKAAEQMFSGLMGISKGFIKDWFNGQYRISFEIVSTKLGIGFYVVTPTEILTTVEKLINGAYPTAEIDIIDPKEIWNRGSYTEIVELTMAGPVHYPIKSYEELGSDGLAALTSAMSKMGDEDVLAIQFVIKPANNLWRSVGERFITNVKSSANPEKPSKIDTSFLQGVEKKVAKPGFDVVIRIVGISDNKVEAEANVRNIVTTFEQYTDVRYNKFKRAKILSKKKLLEDFIYRRIHVLDITIPFFDINLYRNASVLNVEELATVFHFPNKNVQTPNILWLTSRKSPPPTNLPSSGLYLGKSVYRGVEQNVYLSEEDRRRHMYIIGQTGTGKSVFLFSLALQDIKAGKGVAIIDPHGSDLAMLLEKIPEERIKDVVYFDASDTQRPLGINILDWETEEQKNIVINAFIALLYKLYDPNRQGIMGPMLERTIRNVMLTAMADKASTMTDILRLLTDANYYKKFLPLLRDPLVKRYWTDEIANTSDFHKSEKMGYFTSKFDRFVTEKTMRNIIGQARSAINIPKIMEEQKILLVDLSKGKVGEENSQFLGLLLVPKILGAALARSKYVGTTDFPDFYLYVDEFQNFATPDFATILSEARKYKLNLIVANQFVGQLTDDIRDAIFGNVGTLSVFRIGADDAEYFEKQFSPVFTVPDLINNSVGNCYTRLLIKGQPSVPFSMRVDWDAISAQTKSKETAQKIRKYSRMTYGVDVSEVEAFIEERMGFGQKPKSELPSEEDIFGKIPF